MSRKSGELIITVEPTDGFRFRTIKDFNHGHLHGIGGDISVTLVDYEDEEQKCNVIILCTSYQVNKTYPHPNLLIKSERIGQKKTQILDPIKSQLNENWTATFPGMLIVKPTKNDKPENVLNCKLDRIRKYKPNFEINTDDNVDNMNNIRLCFEAFEINGNQFIPIGYPVFSNVITNNNKTFITDFLWICTNCNGPANGNTDLIIVCDHKKSIKKDDIKVRFYQPGENNLSTWQACVDKAPINFCPHSFIIKTPAYQNVKIIDDVRVFFELFVGNKRSEPLQFIYKPNPVQRAGKKRKESQESKSVIDSIIANLPIEKREEFKTAKGLLKNFDFKKLQADGKEDVPSKFPIPTTSTNNNISELELLKELKEEDILHKLIEENAEMKINKLLKVIENHELGKQILNLQNDNGDTCLHIACYFNRVEYIEKLLKLGANPNIRNYDGDTALHVAIENTDMTCISNILNNQKFKIEIELSNDKGYSALYLAIYLKKYDIAKTLITVGNAEIDFENPTNGNNILHLIAEQINLTNMQEIENMIRFLLEQISIIDLNIENRYGLTPLAIAIENAQNEDAQNIIDLFM